MNANEAIDVTTVIFIMLSVVFSVAVVGAIYLIRNYNEKRREGSNRRHRNHRHNK